MCAPLKQPCSCFLQPKPHQAHLRRRHVGAVGAQLANAGEGRPRVGGGGGGEGEAVGGVEEGGVHLQREAGACGGGWAWVGGEGAVDRLTRCACSRLPSPLMHRPSVGLSPAGTCALTRLVQDGDLVPHGRHAGELDARGVAQLHKVDLRGAEGGGEGRRGVWVRGRGKKQVKRSSRSSHAPSQCAAPTTKGTHQPTHRPPARGTSRRRWGRPAPWRRPWRRRPG